MAADQPRRPRGPFTRWPRAADAVLATAVFLATAFLTDGPGDSIVIRPVSDVPIPALLVFAVASAALYWRRRAPLAVLGVAVLAWAVTLGSGYADLGGVAIIALYSAGRYATEDRRAHVGVAAAIAVILVDGLTDPAPWGRPSSAPSSCSWPGTSGAVSACAASAPPSCLGSRPPRPTGS